MKSFALSHQLVLVLTVCIAELHQLSNVIWEYIHLILSTVQIVLLSAIDVIELMLVSLNQLALYIVGAIFEFIYLCDVSRDLLVLLVNEGLDCAWGLQKHIVVLFHFLFQHGLFHLEILDNPLFVDENKIDIRYVTIGEC